MGCRAARPVPDYERGLDEAATPGSLAGLVIGVPDRDHDDGIGRGVAELLATSRAVVETRRKNRRRADWRSRRDRRSVKNANRGRRPWRCICHGCAIAARLIRSKSAHDCGRLGVRATLYRHGTRARGVATALCARLSRMRRAHAPVRDSGPDREGDRHRRVAGHGAGLGQIVANTRRSTFLACPASPCRSALPNGSPQVMQLVGRPSTSRCRSASGVAYDAASGRHTVPASQLDLARTVRKSTTRRSSATLSARARCATMVCVLVILPADADRSRREPSPRGRRSRRS